VIVFVVAAKIWYLQKCAVFIGPPCIYLFIIAVCSRIVLAVAVAIDVACRSSNASRTIASRISPVSIDGFRQTFVIGASWDKGALVRFGVKGQGQYHRGGGV